MPIRTMPVLRVLAMLAAAIMIAPALAGRIPPTIAFDPPTLDFGFVRPAERHTATVRITNTGSQALTGIRTSASCSCTTMEFPITILAPGASADMVVTLKGSYAMIDRTTQVRLHAAGFHAPAELPVRSYPNLGLIATPHMIAGSREGNLPIEQTVTVRAIDGTPFQLRSINLADPDTINPAATEQTFHFRMDTPNKRHWLVIETTHPRCPIVALPVGDGQLRAESLRFTRAASIQAADRREVTLGHIEPGQSIEATIPMFRAAGTLDRTVHLRSRHPGIHAELLRWENTERSHGTPQAPIMMSEAIVRLTATGEPGPIFLSELDFQSDGDPSAVTIHLIGRIVPTGQGTITNDAPPPGLLPPTQR